MGRPLNKTKLADIVCEAQVGALGSELTTGSITKQVSTRRYRVTTTDGTATCTLVQTADLGANEMSITATDSAAGTYFVSKLTAHKATLTQGTGTQFTTGQAVEWTFGAASVNATVQIAST